MDRKEATNILLEQLELSKGNYLGFIDSMINIIVALVDEVEKYEDAINAYCDNIEGGEETNPLAVYSRFCITLERENKMEDN